MLLEFKNNDGRIPESIDYLRKEKNLYLYGTGIYAEKVFAELEKWNVVFKGVIVSDTHYLEKNLFHGMKVKLFDRIKDKKINIVAGYDILVHKELNKTLADSEVVEKVYYLDGYRVFVQDMRMWQDIILMDSYYKRLLKRKLDYAYYHKNIDLFTQTYDWLEDDKSRITMNCFLRGHIEVKDWPMLPVWKMEDVEKQYFPDDIIKLSQHETFVDCGAFTGDTLKIFIGLVEKFNRYYALEPDDTKFTELNNIMEKAKQKGEVIHFPVGVSEKKEKVCFSNASSADGQVIHDAVSADGSKYIELNSIDNLLRGEKNVTFLKMDIEGEELLALKGAQVIIQKYKPKLAICVYHKREDLITIPQYLRYLVPEYKFFLRAHRPCAHEVVLYCVCDQDEPDLCLRQNSRILAGMED